MPNAYERQRVADLAEGGARAAKLIDCPRCGAPILRGDDHDTVAAVAKVDAHEIDLVGEMLAQLDGRQTYSLEPQRGKTARPGARDLWHREPEHHAAGRMPRGTLHREHRCGPKMKGTLW